ncbi:hypothetical protein [Olivibacter sitiensis]|uniref:hypothetical protein n=1 Tax=Olivibacter sitiensis TaxID=376470 RepID=UPI0012F73F3D|nr:hypothetical protein [Olivibacter sitiensis]
MMTCMLNAQEKNDKYLVLKLALPTIYEWKSASFFDEGVWGIAHKGYYRGETYPSLDISQTNMLLADVGKDVHQMATQTLALIKNYEPDSQLKLIKEETIDGDRCLLYAISSSSDQILLLYYRQGSEVMHFLEMEVDKDILTKIPLKKWEGIFFGSKLVYINRD